ncbi:MAG TPA: IS256 family transposase [Clostridia bacterium]|nr:IS256 family transposase [Clostridia bacterium]
MTFFTDDQIKELIKQKNLKTAEDVQDMLKEMFGKTLEQMLEAELENELGYSKYNYKDKKTNNSRNGHTKKKVRSDFGEIDLTIPRDRNSEFEPVVVKKHQKDVSGIEDQIISMYAKGMTVRDIQEHLNNIYGIEASPTLISNITDKLLPVIKEWQNRPLAEIYTMMFLDAIHYKVRVDGHIVSKAAYIVIGIDIEGQKDVLGIWIGESESAKFWLNVLNELKNRGVKDILILSVDNLSGISEAINASFPNTQIQKCVVHQIRNSTKFVSYKDLKKFTADLKPVYHAVSEEEGLRALDIFEEKWGGKYPLAIKSWRNNWTEISTFFRYPEEIRKLIYTTNIIESYHRQLRKVTKSKSVFPTDDALLKMLYLATMDVTRKWTMRVKNWGMILSQFSVYFEDWLSEYLT